MNNDLLLRASAGTGKTYQLTQLFCRLVLENHWLPSQIITLTFTRKAATELRQRIATTLAQKNNDPTILQDLAKSTLTNFHGCALQLLRNYDPDFYSEQIQILGHGGEDRALFLHSALKAFFTEKPKTAEAVRQIAPWCELISELPNALWETLNAAREDQKKIDEHLLLSCCPQQAQQQSHHVLQSIRQQLLQDRTKLTGKSYQKFNAFQLCQPPAADISFTQWLKNWQEMFAHLDRRGLLGHVYSEMMQLTMNQALSTTTAAAISAPLLKHLQVLVTTSWSNYLQQKKHLCAFDFTDLIERAIALLENNVDVRQKIHEHIRAVLVDEAQDTNRIQRHFIDLLRGQYCSQSRPAQLCVVGDWKQSIYTFRGASPKSFKDLANTVLEKGGCEQTLSVSYRSTPAMIKLINHLGLYLFADDYEALCPRVDTATSAVEPDIGGCWLTFQNNSDQEISLCNQTCVGCIENLLQQGKALQDIAILLAHMTHAPTLLAALQQANIPSVMIGGGGFYEQPAVQWILNLLTYLNNPMDALAASVFLISPFVGLGYDALLPLTTAYLDMKHGFWALALGQCNYEKQPLASDRTRLAYCQKVLPALVTAAQQETVAMLFERCDMAFSLRAALLQYDPQGIALANVEYLLTNDDNAHQLIHSFLQRHRWRWQHHISTSLQVPLLQHAVKISSIHQSKGLQYPIVILPHLSSKSRHHTHSLRYSSQLNGIVFAPRSQRTSFYTTSWHQAQMQENENIQAEQRRLLYVAVTRAQSQVIFIGPENSNKATPTSSLAALLHPWLPQAEQANLLTHQIVTLSKQLKIINHNKIQQDISPLTLLSSYQPNGSHLQVSVTTLSRDFKATHLLNTVENLSIPQEAVATYQRVSFGNLAHQVLANLWRAPSEKVDIHFIYEKVANWGKNCSGNITQVAHDLYAFLQTPLGQQIYAAARTTLRCEYPFAVTQQILTYPVTLSGQIDALYATSQQLTILDYKYALFPQDITTYQQHRFQLRCYVYALKKMIPTDKRPIIAYLVYLRDRQYMIQSEKITKADIQEVDKRLTNWVATTGRLLTSSLITSDDLTVSKAAVGE